MTSNIFNDISRRYDSVVGGKTKKLRELRSEECRGTQYQLYWGIRRDNLYFIGLLDAGKIEWVYEAACTTAQLETELRTAVKMAYDRD